MSSVRNATWPRSTGLIAFLVRKPTPRSRSARCSWVWPSVTNATPPPCRPGVARPPARAGAPPGAVCRRAGGARGGPPPRRQGRLRLEAEHGAVERVHRRHVGGAEVDVVEFDLHRRCAPPLVGTALRPVRSARAAT